MHIKRTMAALLMAMGASLAASAVQAQAPVKIGFMAELSGPQAVLGQDQYDAFMLYLEQNGGKLGGVPVEIIKHDSQLKPEVAVQIVRRLMEQDNVPIITGFTFSNMVMAAHRQVTEKGVFLVSSNGAPGPISGKQCSPYQFITSFQTDAFAEAQGQYANDQGWKRVYLMAPNYVAGKDFLAGFKRTYKGTVVNEVYTPLSQSDFAAELTELAASKPDGVFVFYPGGLGVNFVRQYSQAGLLQRIPLLNIGATEISNLPALGDSAVGVLNGGTWGPDIDNEANRSFVKSFEAKYKRQATQTAAQSYDAAQLIASALAKVKGNTSDKQALMAAFQAADFPSVRGNFSFGNNHFPIQDYFVQEVIKDAEGRITLKTVATPLKNYVDRHAQDCPLKK